jgi:PhnB protein
VADVQITPYLSFSGGKTRSVMEFYQNVFGGELSVQTFGDGSHPDESKKDLVMHARLTTDDVDIMASDGMPDDQLIVGNNISISLSGTGGEKIEKYWNSLREGGTVQEELRDAPWGDKFGMLTDQFGIQWMFNITSAANAARQ